METPWGESNMSINIKFAGQVAAKIWEDFQPWAKEQGIDIEDPEDWESWFECYLEGAKSIARMSVDDSSGSEREVTYTFGDVEGEVIEMTKEEMDEIIEHVPPDEERRKGVKTDD